MLSERWSNECSLPTSTKGGYLLGAARAWNAIGEPQNGLAAVEKLLYLMPEEAQGLLTAASTLRTLGRYGDSISRYEAVFSLVAPSRIAHSVYMSYVDSLEKIGQGCAAYDLYILMLRENPPSNIEDVQLWMSKLESEHDCLPKTAAEEQLEKRKPKLIPLDENGVALIKLRVNGALGTFVFDTGASNLSLTPAFAGRAGVKKISDQPVTLRTANGKVDSFRAFVDNVEFDGHLLGGGMAVLLPPSAEGGGIDGLLGMNFISRFNVKMNKNHISLVTK